MNVLLRTSALVCAYLAIWSVGSAQNRTFTSQYSFGDSLSDNGNLYLLTSKTQPPSPPYSNGRFSNGPVWVELLGSNLASAVGVSSVRGNLDFAFGGATAATGGQIPSLAVQIGMYRQQGLPPKSTDLFTVLAGANDLIPVLAAPTTPSNPAALDSAGITAAQAVAGNVQALIGLGAKNIVVAGLPNLGATPRLLAAGGSSFGLRATNAFNTELLTRLRPMAAAAPDVNLVYVDLQGILDRVVLDYKALGFTNATNAFLLTSSAQDPSGFVFWDDIHPTTKTHGILAAIVTEELNPEPVLGFAATEGTAALALADLGQSALNDRLSALALSKRPVGRADAYASYNYGHGNRVGDGWRPVFSFDANIVTAGVDLAISEGMFAGGAANFGRLSSKVAYSGGNYAVQDSTGRLYAGWTGGPVTLVLDGDVGAVNVSGIHRSTAFGGFQTNGKTSGDHWGLGLNVLWNALETSSLTVQPFVGLRTERVRLKAYTERDVPSLTMAYGGQDAAASAGTLGVVFSSLQTIADHRFLFRARGAWHGELSTKARGISGQLANNVTQLTTIQVTDGDGRGVELGGDATYFFAKNWGASVGYTADIRRSDRVESRAVISIQTGF